jgi:DNA-binding NarL/FixJ family response regulator
MMKKLKIVLADDHDVVITGLRLILAQPEFEIVGVVKNGHELVRAARELKPDLIIADVTMPLLNGIDAAEQIRKTNRRIKIIFLTMHPDITYAAEAVAAGGSGYVLKNSAGDELPSAIQKALQGEIYLPASMAAAVTRALELRSRRRRTATDKLTARQQEVLQLLAEGRAVKEIATALNVSPRTVEFHKYRIMEVLGAHSAAELARYAMKKGIVN